MLEVVKSIEKVTKSANSVKITICADNKKLKNMLMKVQIKANDYAQEAGAIVGTIKNMLRKIKLTIDVEFTRGHPKKPKTFEHDPVQ